MERTEVIEKQVTHEGQLVTPLDHPRSFDYGNATMSTASGVIYTPSSGKDVYIKQMIVTEYSGTAGRVRLIDTSGNIIPFVNVNANTTVTWDPRPAACGETHGTIGYVTETFHGEMTLVVQVDPKRIE